MWYSATLTIPPSGPAVTLQQAKDHMRAEDDSQDGVIAALSAAAERHCELYCGIKVMSQTVTAYCDCFADLERIAEGPVSSIVSISYVDPQQAQQTLSNSIYELRTSGLESSVVLKYGQSWPAISHRSRISVVMVVGFAESPAPLVAGIKMLAAHWYENREAVSAESHQEMPIGPANLFENYRRFA